MPECGGGNMIGVGFLKNKPKTHICSETILRHFFGFSQPLKNHFSMNLSPEVVPLNNIHMYLHALYKLQANNWAFFTRPDKKYTRHITKSHGPVAE